MEVDESSIKEVENINKLCEKARNIYLLTVIGALRANKKLTQNYMQVVEMYTKYSPIEQIFIMAFKYVKLFDDSLGKFGINFVCQQDITIGDKVYYVDFYMDFFIIDDVKHYLKKPLIVECDGYDSHSTKEKMSYDYKRESDLKLAGYDILRFTGSQIYKNPLDCAKTVLDYLDKTISEEMNGKS